MDLHTHPTAQRLLQSLMSFRRAGLHQHTIAGYKPSEIRLLFSLRKGIRPECMGMGTTVSEISKRLHVTSPSVTQLLKGLEANGLVERHTDPADRRSVSITLTEKGIAVTQQAMDAFSDSIIGLIEYMGEDQSNQLAELLLKASQYFDVKSANINRSYWSDEVEL